MLNKLKINLAYVDHHFGKDTTLRVGRQLYTPALGLMYDDLIDGHASCINMVSSMYPLAMVTGGVAQVRTKIRKTHYCSYA